MYLSKLTPRFVQSPMLFALMMITALLIFDLPLHLASAKNDFKPLYRANPFRASRPGELTAINVTSHFMEGEFQWGRLGIRFRSESTKATQSITITSSSNGGNIFSSILQSGNTLTVSILLGGDYLVSNGLSSKGRKMEGMRRYHRVTAPKNWRKAAPRGLKLGVPRQHSLPSRYYLQHRGAEKPSQDDIRRLLQSEEAKLIQQAALELGRRGYYGRDSTATMAFYILAMRLAQMQSPSQPHDIPTHCLHGNEEEKIRTTAMTEKEKLLASKGLTLCEQTGRYCALETCPWGEDCVGMCGVGCECWRMVCGDCCSHHGCLGFSEGSCSSCRADSNTISLSCFKVFGFTCDSPFTCS